jgi:hypothetical protein
MSQIGPSGNDQDPVIALWPKWREALRNFHGLTEEEYNIGLEERVLIAINAQLIATSPSSIAGVLIKLHSILELAPVERGMDDFPIPTIRVIIEDLKKLGF